MVEINEALICKIASLAKLKLSKAEIKKFEKDFKEILKAFKILDEVNTNSVKSSFRPFEEKNHLREDKIKPSLYHPINKVRNKEEHFFKAPKTIE